MAFPFCYTFVPSQDIKPNLLLSSYFDSRRCHKLQDLFKDQALKGEKEGKLEIQKFEYLENKELFEWNKKTSLLVFEGLSFGKKQKFDKK